MINLRFLLKMNKLLPLLLALVFLVQTVSAYTYLNIYLDSSGNTEFFGETNETNSALEPYIPEGVSVAEGRIRGTTQELTAKIGETWTFTYLLPGAEIKAILPEGATVKSLSNNNAEIFLDRGRISVYF